MSPVPVANQLRTYLWCSPPRIGRQRIRPALLTVRDRSESLFKDRCVRVVIHIRQQEMGKMPLAEHNNVVKAFPSDRTDQPFGICVLPRGAWRCWAVANAYRSESADKDLTIGPRPGHA